MKTTLEMLSDAGFQAKFQSRCLAYIVVHLTGGNEAFTFYPLFYGRRPRRRARIRDSTGGRAGTPQPARPAAAAAAHRRAAHVCEAYKSR